MISAATIVRDMPPPPEEERSDAEALLEAAAAVTAVTASKTFPDGTVAATTTAPGNGGSTILPTGDGGSSYINNNNGNNNGNSNTMDHSVATLSNPWEYDCEQSHCTQCRDEFHPFNRRHHCRLCGKIFCNKCSDQRALIPPSAIVLTPMGGKKAQPPTRQQQDQINATSVRTLQQQQYDDDPDPDRMLTYIDNEQQLLYGKGLEERFLLAREPLRVCLVCYQQLQPLQVELRNSNSNAMRFNHIDPTDPKRFFNSPVAFTLGHEVRKAAYALNNLLPMPKRMGSVLVETSSTTTPARGGGGGPDGGGPSMFRVDEFLTGDARDIQQCKDECATISPNFSNLDGVRIPARLLEQAKGVAVMTVVKGGFGLAGIEFGTGLVVARLGGDQQWSAPCAIGTAGLSWGALIGAQVSDHVFLLMTDAAVELMFNSNGNLQLGADIGVAIGPVGRALEADLATAPGSVAPIYTYSMSKGLYAGISLDGKVIVTRNRVNERFYGREVSGMQILAGEIPSPPAARPLYEALQRCHVYATGNLRGSMGVSGGGSMGGPGSNYLRTNWPNDTMTMQGYPQQQQQQYQSGMYLPQQQQQQDEQQYWDDQLDYVGWSAGGGGGDGLMPPAPNDQHSYAGMSDITSDPGY